MTLKPDPKSYPPLGMSREDAAHYISVSTFKFDDMVARRVMPKPRQDGGRLIWDRHELEVAFRALPHQDDGNFFDQKKAG